MKVESLSLQRFTAFQEVRLEFADGINVLVGENATGKSHLLKLLYCILHTFERGRGNLPGIIIKGRRVVSRQRLAARLNDKLAAVFRPDEGRTERLVRRRQGRGDADVTLTGSEGAVALHLSNELRLKKASWRSPKPTIFVPSREVLAMYEGFVGAYQTRELSFDETYHDVCVALSASPLKGAREKVARKLLRPIVEALGGAVSRQGDRFYVNLDGKMEAHLVAEGLRKIACLAYLLKNGSLQQNGILLWDEPEANLNPRLIARVVEFLRELAANGVQIFLATHDYLLCRKLSLATEYALDPKVRTRFISLYRAAPSAPVEAQWGDTLADLEKNAIVDEFVSTYDEELEMFRSRDG